MKKETWKDIPGYEGRYQVSSLGRVRTDSGKIMSLELTQRGYFRVELWSDHSRKRFKVHRLVAIVFIPNPKNLPQVDHINGDKTDNRVENLRWVSNIQNCGFNNKKKSSRRPVLIIGRDGAKDVYPSISAAARAMGVSRYGVMAVLNGTQKTTANGRRVSYGN